MRSLMVLLWVAQAVVVLSAQPSPPAADEIAIRALVGRYVDAREVRDPQSIEALFTPDADQHTTSGEWRRGRDRIVPGALASSQRNAGRRSITVETVRFITADVAIADGPYEIGDAESASVRRMWTTFVLRREAAGWRISAIRNMVPTGTPAPGLR